VHRQFAWQFPLRAALCTKAGLGVRMSPARAAGDWANWQLEIHVQQAATLAQSREGQGGMMRVGQQRHGDEASERVSAISLGIGREPMRAGGARAVRALPRLAAGGKLSARRSVVSCGARGSRVGVASHAERPAPLRRCAGATLAASRDAPVREYGARPAMEGAACPTPGRRRWRRRAQHAARVRWHRARRAQGAGANDAYAPPGCASWVPVPFASESVCCLARVRHKGTGRPVCAASWTSRVNSAPWAGGPPADALPRCRHANEAPPLAVARALTLHRVARLWVGCAGGVFE
jgi:hypothetical protein